MSNFEFSVKTNLIQEKNKEVVIFFTLHRDQAYITKLTAVFRFFETDAKKKSITLRYSSQNAYRFKSYCSTSLRSSKKVYFCSNRLHYVQHLFTWDFLHSDNFDNLISKFSKVIQCSSKTFDYRSLYWDRKFSYRQTVYRVPATAICNEMLRVLLLSKKNVSKKFYLLRQDLSW